MKDLSQCGKVGSGALTSRGLQQERADYTRARLTNRVTGNLEEVILLPSDKLNRLRELSQPSMDYLRADLNRAFSQFTIGERKILVNTLVRGMALEKAVAGKKKSITHWRNWQRGAMLKLQRALHDYIEVKIDPVEAGWRKEIVI